MGRKPNPERKPELLDAVVDELARTGIADLSMRPLATAVGVSTFTLSYHFGSKEQLLAEALEHIEGVQRAAIASWFEDGDLSIGEVVRRYWAWSEEPSNLARMRVIYEALAQPPAAETMTDEARVRLTADWVQMIADELRRTGVPSRVAAAEATLAAAAIAGMQIDLLSTGDTKRLRAAARHLADHLDALAN